MTDDTEMKAFLTELTKLSRFPIVGALTGTLNRHLYKAATESGFIESRRVGPTSMTNLTAAGFAYIGRREHDYSQG